MCIYIYFTQHYIYASNRSKHKLNYIFGSYGGHVMILCSKIKSGSQLVF